MAIELVKLSLTEQVASILERQIVEGKLKPNSKLKSTRGLAESFKTSRQVVRSALDILAQKKLIVHSYNNGYYVSGSAYSPNQKEVYILGYGIDESHRFFHNILNITSHVNLREGYSFSTRIIGSRQKLSSEILDFELQRIESMHGINTILVNAVNFDYEAVLRCETLNIPVIYIGDFAEEFEMAVPINQIKASGGQVVAKSSEFLTRRGIKKIVCLTGSLEYNFNVAVVEEFRRHFGGFDCFELPPNCNFNSSDEQLRAFAGIIGQNIHAFAGTEDQAVVINGVADELIADAFKMNGMKVGEDVKVFSTNTDIEELSCLHYDYSPLYDVLYERIDELNSDPSTHKIIETELKIDFIDHGTV